MSQGRAKPLLATESGQDITDRKASLVREFAIFSPEVELLLREISDKLSILIEYERIKREGL
jgi:hypothetical protein